MIEDELREGWPQQQLRLPIAWYETIAAHTAHGFPISGDATTIQKEQKK